MNKTLIIIMGAMITFFIASCQSSIKDFEKAERAILAKNMYNYLSVLASDSFMGRLPLSVGETLTIAYLEKVFRDDLGLHAGINGSYFQEVTLMEVNNHVSEYMDINLKSKTIRLENQKDFVMNSRKVKDTISIDTSELVFAGYGIVAPEYKWDDYKDLDVKGKIVVVLVNDPGLATSKPEVFKGRSMTYYGRWTYKYEEAARQGAKGVLIVHDTEGAGYPWSVVVNGAITPNLYLQSDDGYSGFCDMEGWISAGAAIQLFQEAGLDFATEKQKASQNGFIPYSLGANASAAITSSFKYGISHNVIGLLPGTDLADEVIIFSAHWDHLGTGPAQNGDSIYNGAVDNGTSIAWMLEIARAFKTLETKPRRSILFIATTAEEQGLLGAYHYVNNPAFPLDKTIANFNNDLMLPLGKMKDVMITGYGQSELDELVEEAAKRQGRYILPDPNPETGMYFRADHFAFAKAGVPAMFARGNNHHWEYGMEWTAKKEKEWLANNYHKPADNYNPASWNLDGVVEDARLMFYVAWKLANSENYPQWKEGSEFKKLR